MSPDSHIQARRAGLTPRYIDMEGRLTTVTAEAAGAVQHALQAGGPGIRLRDQLPPPGQVALDPVAVAWDGEGGRLRLIACGSRPPAECEAELVYASDGEFGWRVDLSWRRQGGSDGEAWIATVRIPETLPLGRHRIRVRIGEQALEGWVIAAPLTAPRRLSGWGVFAPLHAARRRKSWEIGDFTSLRMLREAVGAAGGGFVSTLPVVATAPGQASPYVPISRLMWNDRYVDVEALPEAAECPGVAALLGSDRLRSLLRRQWREPIAGDTGESLRREALGLLAAWVRDEAGERQREFDAWVSDHPRVRAFAEFMARTYPDAAAADAWAYGQWAATRQLRDATGELPAPDSSSVSTSPGVIFDFPLGVAGDGFDAAEFPNLFVDGISVGAPPDDFFTGGQDWGFPPMHPGVLRASGYEYLARALRHNLAHASGLRIDHVMALHRLYWIPAGASAKEGVYVRYPSEELYAVACLEAHRAGADLIGEDLGTVPPSVRRAMQRHGVRRTVVGQFEVRPWPEDRAPAEGAGGRYGPHAPPPPGALAAINTHDTPTFAGWWAGADIARRDRTGMLTSDGTRHETRVRLRQRHTLVLSLRRAGLLSDGHPWSVLKAWLTWLAGTGLTQVTLEDLWLERRQVNIPGTGPEEPNWRRVMALPLEDALAHPQVRAILEAVRAASLDLSRDFGRRDS